MISRSRILAIAAAVRADFACAVEHGRYGSSLDFYRPITKPEMELVLEELEQDGRDAYRHKARKAG